MCGFETLKRRLGRPCIRERIEEKAESHWRPYLALFSYLLRIVLLWFVKHIVKDVCFAHYIKIGSSASFSELSSWLEETNKMKTNVLFFYISRFLVEHKTFRIGHNVPFSVVSSYSNRTTDGLNVRKFSVPLSTQGRTGNGTSDSALGSCCCHEECFPQVLLSCNSSGWFLYSRKDLLDSRTTAANSSSHLAIL